MLKNPIILKECLQAAHRKRTYAFRALLVVAALGAIVPQVVSVLSAQGQDWRTIADLSRAVFVGGSWTALIAFSLFAYVFSTASITEEWRRKTMEVLCASPLSWPAIVFGKLIGAFGKLAMLALALLPVAGLWYHMARVPRRMVLGAFAIVFASTFFFASVALLQSVLFKPGRGHGLSFAVLLVPYYALIGMAYAAGLHEALPILEAACSPRALFLVLADSPPGAMSVARFVGMSAALHVGLGALALSFASPALARTFGRHMAGGGTRFVGLLKRLAGKRPRMKPNEDPFLWQEKGPPTAFIRWVVWAGLAVACLLLAARVLGDREMGPFLWVLRSAGMLAINLGCMIYGANVFAREKLRGSAGVLILTGASPARVLRAKLMAVYWALRFVLLPVALLSTMGTYLYLGAVLGGFQGPADIPKGIVLNFSLSTLRTCIIGPAGAAVVAMVFSAHARSGLRAFGALLAVTVLSSLFAFLLRFTLMRFTGAVLSSDFRQVATLLVFGIAILSLLAFVKRWTLWRLCLLTMLVTWLHVPLNRILFGTLALSTSSSDWSVFSTLVGQGGQAVISLFNILFWFWLGTRLFEAGMTEQASPLYLRRTLRNGMRRIGRMWKYGTAP